MDKDMRRLLTIDCEDVALAATLDDAPGSTGLLIVTGGSQTRIGSHRLFERLAAGLAARGIAVLRFDRRGVGDSEGEDPGFRASGDDLAAAASAFREAAPQVRHIVGFGLCDGATALAMFGAAAGLDSLIMVNPWLVEAQSGEPPAAAIKAHYRRRLFSVNFWKQAFAGGIDYRKALRGILKIAKPQPATLEGEVAAALSRNGLPVRLILAERDATAIAARAVWDSERFRVIRQRAPAPAVIATDSHTFARPGDGDRLLRATLDALTR